MRFTAGRSALRRAVIATALTAAASLAIPTVATAAPEASEKPQTADQVDQRVLDAISAFTPALIGAAATPGADGEIDTSLLEQASVLADVPGAPPELAAIWDDLTSFLAGSPAEARQVAARHQVDEERRPGDPEIPQGPDAPRIQEFLYPTIGVGCTGGPDFNASLGRGLVTAGPQQAPAPGPKAGEAGFVYTSLGTGPAVNNPGRKLWVSWLNVDTGKTGQTQLRRNEQINATDGPGTFTAVAATGKGRVLSTIYGDVTTRNDERVTSCTIAPTIGLAVI